jgi:hypothetical protein
VDAVVVAPQQLVEGAPVAALGGRDQLRVVLFGADALNPRR